MKQFNLNSLNKISKLAKKATKFWCNLHVIYMEITYPVIFYGCVNSSIQTLKSTAAVFQRAQFHDTHVLIDCVSTWKWLWDRVVKCWSKLSLQIHLPEFHKQTSKLQLAWRFCCPTILFANTALHCLQNVRPQHATH